jgi:hypothetical protein
MDRMLEAEHGLTSTKDYGVDDSDSWENTYQFLTDSPVSLSFDLLGLERIIISHDPDKEWSIVVTEKTPQGTLSIIKCQEPQGVLSLLTKPSTLKVSGRGYSLLAALENALSDQSLDATVSTEIQKPWQEGAWDEIHYVAGMACSDGGSGVLAIKGKLFIQSLQMGMASMGLELSALQLMTCERDSWTDLTCCLKCSVGRLPSSPSEEASETGRKTDFERDTPSKAEHEQSVIAQKKNEEVRGRNIMWDVTITACSTLWLSIAVFLISGRLKDN